MVSPVVSGAWNPQMYAMAALRYLKAKKTFLRTVNTQYDAERGGSFNQGNVINVRKKQTITVRDETDLSFDTLNPDSLQITLDTYRHASFETLDYDLAFAGQRLVDEQIMPAVDALAENVSSACLTAAYKAVGAYHLVAATSGYGVEDITGPQAILMQNRCPVEDERNMFYALSPTMNQGFLNLSAFTQHQGAGQQGVADQITGQIQRRYGFNFLPTQLIPTFGGHTLSATTLAVLADTSKGATTIGLDAGSLTGSITPGTVFTIAGDTTVYCATNTVAASGNALAGVTITPALQVAAAEDAVVTVVASASVAKKQNLAYHRDAFAFVAAPLPRTAMHQASAMMGVATDPDSGLSLRLAFGWDIKTNKAMGKVDILCGFKVLNPFLACRVIE